MKKFKVFVDFKKEEQYLNGMAAKGYILEKYSSFGFYTFKKSAPQSLDYKVDYRVFSTKDKFNDYVTLFEDAGWKHVYGTARSGSQYFLPDPTKEQTGDIFSDPQSEAERYKRFISQCFASFSLMLVYLIIFFPTSWKLLDPHSWYFTRGLWEMTGGMFWKAFWFETPFVILRIFPLVLFAFLGILYGYWGIKANRAAKRAAEQQEVQTEF